MLPNSPVHMPPVPSFEVADVLERTLEWIEQEASSTPGFCGAHLKGSLLTAPTGEPWPSYRDVDVNILLEGVGESYRFSDVRHRGVLIDCTWIDAAYYDSVEGLLENMALAPNLALPGVLLADPQGRLRPVVDQVAEQYAEKRWVRARCMRCREAATVHRAALDSGSLLEAGTMLWKLVGRICAQLALAHLRPPTHRRCLVVAGEFLQQSGRSDLYQALLELSGFSTVTSEQAQQLVAECEDLFDRALARIEAGDQLPPTSRFRPLARDYVLAGSRSMIEAGHPREAMHWTVAQLSLTLSALLHLEDPSERPRLRKRLLELVAHQGLATDQDRRRCVEQAKAVCRDVDGFVDEYLETH